METISGLTNWRLTVRRETEGVTILRAVTCDENAALPDEIFGLPVTGLSDRALAHGAKPAEGEEVTVLGGAEGADWDNRNITALTLPRGLQSVGDYAFMNLRRMETLRFFDGVRTFGRFRPMGKGAVGKACDRQAEDLVRQGGIFVAGHGAQDRDAVFLPPHRETPVCKAADGFHADSPLL